MLTKEFISVDEVRLDEDIVFVQLAASDATWSLSIKDFLSWCNEASQFCNNPQQKPNWVLGPSSIKNYSEYLIELDRARNGIYIRYNVSLASLKIILEWADK